MRDSDTNSLRHLARSALREVPFKNGIAGGPVGAPERDDYSATAALRADKCQARAAMRAARVPPVRSPSAPASEAEPVPSRRHRSLT